MIDIRKLKELVRLMVENELSELDLRDEQETVTIKRGDSGPPQVIAPAVSQVAAAPAAAPAAGAAPQAPAAPAEDASLVAIESPMVGTYYSKPNPDSDSFVKPGAGIGPDTVVCIVEAMKVFNEIKAETSGTIERILVKDGDSVEFGQKLFLVRPA
ncbi:MAG: acetyl-CoA carboxylase biotin carboxyl carrier protein [Phycisphaerales bacterium]